jgi:glycosyltransferase involved in cell wall biosynthesis
MKKVLVITYYWPPSGGAGVQRWLKFVKYLRNFGWEPVIYTPENTEMPSEDRSLATDVPEGITVLKSRIWEPYTAYKKFVGRKSTDRIKTGFLSEKKTPSVTEQISVWIRGNLFIPDARKYWIKPSVNFLTDYLKDNPVDVVVSTGPPHSMHLIALGLKNKLDIPWLADFRDPWTSIDFYKDLKLTPRSDRKHRKLEKQVLSKADRVVVISPGMKKDFENILPKPYDVVTNGYDLPEIPQLTNSNEGAFSITHIGSLVPSRNPEMLWKALGELIEENQEFAESLKIQLVGQMDHSVVSSIEQYKLQKYLDTRDYLPNQEVIGLQQQAGVLLLLINDTPSSRLILTGKVFEYIVSGRPILCIGPTDGDAAALLSETNTGITVKHDDHTGIKIALLDYFIRFRNNELTVNARGLERYSRENLTKQMAGILNEM